MLKEDELNESYIPIDNEHIYVRHTDIKPDRHSLLFVHGLGDSGISYEDAFKYDFLSDCNIVVPDLIGYGRSSAASSLERYHYKAHIERLWKLIEMLNLTDIILLGHSMGGDISTLMSRENRDRLVRKYINIEGDITQHDLFISSRAVEAFNSGDFPGWFEEHFKYKLIFQKFGHQRSSRLYFASLNFCRPEAFLENAKELVARNTKLDSEFKSEIGEIFASLGIPRVYCYGTLSCPKQTLKFLEQKNLPTRKFESAGHSLMVDSSEEFYRFVHEFIQ